jgi:hypothetical protein
VVTVPATLHVVPALTIVSAATSVTLSWPAAPAGYSLESTGALLPPGGDTVWTPVATPPVANAGYQTVTVPASSGQRFFRLKKP